MRLRTLLGMDRRGLVILAALSIPAAACANPGLLPWDWHEQVGRFDVYAETAPGPRIEAELARSAALLATSPIDDQSVRPTVYLTDGGLRWRFLSLAQHDAFAVTRPVFGGTIVNRSDVAQDAVYARGYRRTLSGVVAHETTHVLQRRRVGLAAFLQMPAWVKEGYADHVAQESTLSDADVARLRAQKRGDPAIFYHDARGRVADALAHGETVDELLKSTS